jgi:hypothetical protein
MKYLTASRYLEFQQATDERSFRTALADWERASKAYRKYLRSILPKLPKKLARFAERECLHDAILLDGFRGHSKLTLVVKTESPADKRFLLEYSLVEKPRIETHLFPADNCSATASWLYDEIRLEKQRFGHSGPVFSHSILLGDGREITLSFRRFSYSERQPSGIAPPSLGEGAPSFLSRPA